jgi:outer membrane protein TolC
LSRVVDDIRAEVEQARLKLIEAQHVAHLYKTRLLPAARDQVDAVLAGFQTGRNSFFEVMNAQKNLLTTELGRHMAVAEMHRRVAALDRALGRPAGLEGQGSRP